MHIDQLNHCCEYSVRAQAAQNHVAKGVFVSQICIIDQAVSAERSG